MKVFYGPKGTGKTKAMIDGANAAIENAKGHVVFITDTKRYSYDIKYQVRVLDTNEYKVNSIDGLCGFISGVVAANNDNEYIYLDGVARICNAPLSDLGKLFGQIEDLEKEFGVKFIVSASADKQDLPDFVLKYVE